MKNILSAFTSLYSASQGKDVPPASSPATADDDTAGSEAAEREREVVAESPSEEKDAVEEKLSEERMDRKKPAVGKDQGMPKKKEPKKKKATSAEKRQKAKL